MIHVCMEARKGIGSSGFGGRSSPKGGLGGGNRGGGVSVRAQASLVALLAKLLPIVLPILIELLDKQDPNGQGPERVQ